MVDSNDTGEFVVLDMVEFRKRRAKRRGISGAGFDSYGNVIDLPAIAADNVETATTMIDQFEEAWREDPDQTLDEFIGLLIRDNPRLAQRLDLFPKLRLVPAVEDDTEG